VWLCVYLYATNLKQGITRREEQYIRCSFSSSLSYSYQSLPASQPSLSLRAWIGTVPLALTAYHFQLVLFLTDSQSALTLLFSTLTFLQPKFFWDIWTLSDSLSSREAVSFQWVPEWTGRFRAKTGAHSSNRSSQSVSASKFKVKTHPLLHLEMVSLYNLFCQIALASSEESTLLNLVRCELSRLCCHGHSFLLFYYLCRIIRKNSCRACGAITITRSSSLPSGLSRISAIHIWHTSNFDFKSRPWGVARLLGLRPYPLEGVG